LIAVKHSRHKGFQVLAGLRTVALNLLRLNGFHSIADGLGAVSHNVALLMRLMCWHGQRGPQTASA
jgi:hypothetical protein